MATFFAGLTSDDISALTTSTLVSLSTANFAALTSDQVPGLTTEQLAVLKTSQVRALSTDSIAAFTTYQINQGLTTAQLAALTTAQVRSLTTDQLQQGLTTDQVVALTTAQVRALTTAQIQQGLTTEQVAALETHDIVVLTTSQVAALTTDQVQQGLTTDQVVALTTAQLRSLTTDQIQGLTIAQVAALETRDVAVLSTAQLASLTTAQIQQGLTTNQVVALTTAQVVSLQTDQLISLTTDHVVALSTFQIEALTSTGLMSALTTEQLAAITGNLSATPLVLDLNGDGITTQNINKGVKFDIYGVGQDVNTGWIAGGDGLLVIDRNRDGTINGGTELFGEGTNLANGQKATNGYQALAELDANMDGSISSSDASFNDLMVWVDGNSDGISQTGELHSLQSLGITSMDLGVKTSDAINNGNLVGLVSNYTMSDGNTRQMADVWFATKAIATGGVIPEPNVPTVPILPTANLVMTGSVAIAPVQGDSISEAVSTTDLQTKVVSLVDAMQAFNSPGTVKTTESQTTSLVQLASSAPSISSGLMGIVDTLKRFDANGQPLTSVAGTSVAATVTLKTTLFVKPESDMLAQSK